ncbi:hypothetical protein [Bacillus thuringiensis]|nr:hypothetical protein [Bacillus thuringiensis]MEB4818102.1 hypothetical protein [Bacillus thuringiensis]
MYHYSGSLQLFMVFMLVYSMKMLHRWDDFPQICDLSLFVYENHLL